MAWDIMDKNEYEIENIGTVSIERENDDWNRYRTQVYLKSSTHHLEEKHYYKPGDGPGTNYYAVPNGMTINPPLNLPKIKFNDISEQFCNKFPMKTLITYYTQLKGNRAKFEYPMNRKNALHDILYCYYEHYKISDRIHCASKVEEAIEKYNIYPYNYEKWSKKETIAENEQSKKISEIVKLSHHIL